MSTDEKRNEQLADELKQAVDNAVEESAEAAEAAPESSPSADLEALQAKVQEFQEQVLRSQAEMQNVRRRAENDVEKAHKFAVEKFVKELLPVVDSLEKAVESTEGHESSGDLVASIRQGVELTLEMFLSGLKKFNVERLNPVGE
ncbi:MAG TPA: nucleotide exchange factor GrpE, partial [Marinobacter sp.]|nr:nucleotide exchange factor GrpE [Marinobacter sp.]